MYICIDICIYIHTCTEPYTYIYICIYIYIYVHSRPASECNLGPSHGVALVSRIDKIIGVFCKRALQKRRYSAKETCNLSILLTVATPYPNIDLDSLGAIWDVTQLYICDTTHFYAWQQRIDKMDLDSLRVIWDTDSIMHLRLVTFLCVTWLISMRDSNEWPKKNIDSNWVIWDIPMYYVTHFYLWHDSFLCVTTTNGQNKSWQP